MLFDNLIMEVGMHIYPQDFKPRMLVQWIDNAIEMGDWSIDIRFIVPNDMHNVNTKCTEHTDLSHNILGEISQTILMDNRVNGSITFVGTTATIYIVLV